MSCWGFFNNILYLREFYKLFYDLSKEGKDYAFKNCVITWFFGGFACIWCGKVAGGKCQW